MNNSTSQTKNKLTMVCLTYNRQSFAKRQLLYFADKPVNLIIADGSEKPWSLGTNGNIGQMNWCYFNINYRNL